MRRMKGSSIFSGFLGVSALVALTNCSAAQQVSDRQASPPSVASSSAATVVAAGIEPRPVRLDRIGFGDSPDRVIGKYGFGIGCFSAPEQLTIESKRLSVDQASYEIAFRDVLQAANYELAGNPNALFEDRDADRADFLIGALISNLDVRICESLANRERGEASMEVEWQVYDPRQREVAYTVTTSADVKTGSELNGGAAVMIQAFGEAARGLVGDSGFYDLVVGQDNGGLGAGRQADITKIKSITLSATPFQSNITMTRARVATLFAGSGMGSGFFIADNLLLTNAHVVGGAQLITVRLVTGRELVGEVVATSTARDVALVRTENSGFGGLPMGLTQPGVGDRIFVIGSPMDPDLESTVSAGIVSAFRTEEGQRYIQSDVNVLQGNSGGPMFDDKGNVIGITVIGMFGQGSGLNLFIPIADALSALSIEVADG